MPERGEKFPIRSKGNTAAIDKRITKELSSGKGYSPDDVPKSPLVKAISKLDEEQQMIIIISLCERILWFEKHGVWPGVISHASDILSAVWGRKVFSWSKKQVEKITSVGAGLGNLYWKLPAKQIVAMLEKADSLSGATKKSIKRIRKEMLALESVEHHRLAKRLAETI